MQVNMALELYSQILVGVERVIAYGSCTQSENNYCATCRELLTLVYFLHYFRAYLLGSLFVARTDHTVFQHFKEPEGQWLEQLQEFDFHIEHQSGKFYNNADALSRITHDVKHTTSVIPTCALSTGTTQVTDSWAPTWPRQNYGRSKKQTLSQGW